MRYLIIILCVFLLPVVSNAAVLFEDDFEYTWTFVGTNGGSELYPCTKAGSGSCTAATNYAPSGYDTGDRTNNNSWNGWTRPATSYVMEITSGHGRNGGGGLQVTYPACDGCASGEPRMLKWLGATGETELYIGWWFKLDDTGGDAWVWENPNGFSFWKMMRLYQNVDLEALAERCDLPGYWSVHPSNYPNYLIFDMVNLGTYVDRDYVPIPATYGSYGAWTTGADSYRRVEHWYHFGATYVADAILSPATGDSETRMGTIYDDDEVSPGEYKYTQDWHHIEIHIKLRTVTEGTKYAATYVSATSLTINDDHTGTFTNGTEVIVRGCGSYSDCATPVTARVDSSSFADSKTTITIIDDPVYSQAGDILSANMTTVAVVTENDAGTEEWWFDGDHMGAHVVGRGDSPGLNTLTSLNQLFGGFNFIQWPDNRYYLAATANSVYYDDFVVSTTRIGTSYAPGGAEAAITGTVTDNITESDIKTVGGKTIIITLTGDEWVSTVGEDNAITTALIAGIDADGAEGAGWDAVVKNNMVHGDVDRDSATVVIITLGAEAGYDITTGETITVTIPATALEGGGEVVATPTFGVSAEQIGSEWPTTSAYNASGPTLLHVTDGVTIEGAP